MTKKSKKHSKKRSVKTTKKSNTTERELGSKWDSVFRKLDKFRILIWCKFLLESFFNYFKDDF